jgi:hypothetical protein
LIFLPSGVFAVTHRSVTDVRVVVHDVIFGVKVGEAADAGTVASVSVNRTRSATSLG